MDRLRTFTQTECRNTDGLTKWGWNLLRYIDQPTKDLADDFGALLGRCRAGLVETADSVDEAARLFRADDEQSAWELASLFPGAPLKLDIDAVTVRRG